MYELSSIISVGMCAAGLMLALIELYFAVIDHTIEPWSRRFFIRFFSVTTLCAASSLIFESLYNVPGHRVAAQIFLYAESLFSSLLMPMLTLYLLPILFSCLSPSLRTSSITLSRITSITAGPGIPCCWFRRC